MQQSLLAFNLIRSRPEDDNLLAMTVCGVLMGGQRRRRQQQILTSTAG